MKTIEPYSPSARAKASVKPVRSGGRRFGKTTLQERLQARGPEDSGRLLELRVELLEDGLDGAHDEREADERQREDDAERRERDLDAERLEEPADPAVARVERREREAGDRRRQREREVHEGVEEARRPRNR